MGTHDELRGISDRWREYVDDVGDYATVGAAEYLAAYADARQTDDEDLSDDDGPDIEPATGMRYDLIISWDDDSDDGMAGWVATFLAGSVRAFVPGAVCTYVDHQA